MRSLTFGSARERANAWWRGLRTLISALLCLLTMSPSVVLTRTRDSWPSVDRQSITHYEKAVEQVRQRNFQEAIKHLESSTQRAPHFYQAFSLMGVCYERLGDHEKANLFFRQALKINPRFDEGHVKLGANHVTQGRVSEGIAEFKKAIELNPRSVSAFFNLGYTELKHGDPARAVEPLKKAYGLSDPDPSVFIILVGALIKTGQIDQALRYGEDLLRLKPPDPQLQMHVGLVFLHSGQCEAAQRYLRAGAKADSVLRDQVMRLSENAFDERRYGEALCLLNVVREFVPDPAPLHSMAGACHYHLQNPALAVEEVQNAIRLDPGHEEYYIQLAQIFIDYSTPKAAVQLLEAAVGIFPSSSRIRFVLGVACIKASQTRKAERYLRESLRIQSRNPPTLRALVVLYEGESRWGSLLEVGELMVEFQDLQHEGYYYQAISFYNLFRDQPDRLLQIKTLLRKSLALESNFAPSHLMLGKLLREQGSYAEAVESLKRAIALDPESVGAHYNLARAYRELGETQKSAQMRKMFEILERKAAKNKGRDKVLFYETLGKE